MDLPNGYNCRGDVYLGDSRTSTVFDTGATRGSIDSDFLKTLTKRPETECEVLDFWSIGSAPCQGMSQSNQVEIKHMRKIRLSSLAQQWHSNSWDGGNPRNP